MYSQTHRSRPRLAQSLAFAIAFLLAGACDNSSAPDSELDEGTLRNVPDNLEELNKADVPPWITIKKEILPCDGTLAGRFKGADSAHGFNFAGAQGQKMKLRAEVEYATSKGVNIGIWDLASGKKLKFKTQYAPALDIDFKFPKTGNYVVAIFSSTVKATGKYSIKTTCEASECKSSDQCGAGMYCLIPKCYSITPEGDYCSMAGQCVKEPNCNALLCSPGKTCKTVDVKCNSAPCPAIPLCLPNQECPSLSDYCAGFCSGDPIDMPPGCTIPACTCANPGTCSIDSHCSAGEWCRPTAGGEGECVPFAGEGAQCSGFVPPWLVSKCGVGLTCVDVDPSLTDEPGICAVFASVDKLLSEPQKYAGHLVATGGSLVTAPASCTKSFCQPSNPCCNQCNARQVLAASSNIFNPSTESIALSPASGGEVVCSGNNCNYEEQCPYAEGSYMAVGKFEHSTSNDLVPNRLHVDHLFSPSIE